LLKLRGVRKIFSAMNNSYWLIFDCNEMDVIKKCIGSLEKDGKITVASVSPGDHFATLVVATSLDRSALIAACSDYGVIFRFTSAEGIAEYLQGFAKGFNVAGKLFLPQK